MIEIPCIGICTLVEKRCIGCIRTKEQMINYIIISHWYDFIGTVKNPNNDYKGSLSKKVLPKVIKKVKNLLKINPC